jgi:hypothetical protein
VESQSRVEDTGALNGQNSTETTAVVPIQTATSIAKYSDNLYTACIIQGYHLGAIVGHTVINELIV